VLLTELDETAAAIASGAEMPRGRSRVSAPLLLSQTAMGKIAAGFALKYRMSDLRSPLKIAPSI